MPSRHISGNPQNAIGNNKEIRGTGNSRIASVVRGIRNQHPVEKSWDAAVVTSWSWDIGQ